MLASDQNYARIQIFKEVGRTLSELLSEMEIIESEPKYSRIVGEPSKIYDVFDKQDKKIGSVVVTHEVNCDFDPKYSEISVKLQDKYSKNNVNDLREGFLQKYRDENKKYSGVFVKSDKAVKDIPELREYDAPLHGWTAGSLIMLYDLLESQTKADGGVMWLSNLLNVSYQELIEMKNTAGKVLGEEYLQAKKEWDEFCNK